MASFREATTTIARDKTEFTNYSWKRLLWSMAFTLENFSGDYDSVLKGTIILRIPSYWNFLILALKCRVAKHPLLCSAILPWVWVHTHKCALLFFQFPVSPIERCGRSGRKWCEGSLPEILEDLPVYIDNTEFDGQSLIHYRQFCVVIASWTRPIYYSRFR